MLAAVHISTSSVSAAVPAVPSSSSAIAATGATRTAPTTAVLRAGDGHNARRTSESDARQRAAPTMPTLLARGASGGAWGSKVPENLLPPL